jgi:hypothetical protein
MGFNMGFSLSPYALRLTGFYFRQDKSVSAIFLGLYGLQSFHIRVPDGKKRACGAQAAT